MLAIGSIVDGKYKILSEIGHGGMSVVYMAINEKANKTWAIKEVRKDPSVDMDFVTTGLMNEINTLKKLKHPYLPSIVDVIDDEDSYLIVMDYIEGRSLDKIIEETGAQPEEYVVKWAKQLCDVFGYLHSRNPAIIYRDLKPANIMLRPDGNITVIDFGTVKNYETNAGETTNIGTKGYAAPEQYMGTSLGRTDARTDIYSLGVTLYYLLTNVDPTRNVLNNVLSIREKNPALSRGLDSIIRKCTNYLPEQRYQSCAELQYDLENYQRIEPLYRKRQKRKLVLFSITMGLSLLLLIAGFVFRGMAGNKAEENYLRKIREAEKSSQYEDKIELYRDSIEIANMSGRIDAYLGLIQTFKDNDAVFSVEESKLLEKLVKSNMRTLTENREDYTKLCFEIGKLYWYYYDDGTSNQITRSKFSIEWFQDVIDYAAENYENRVMAEVYLNIGLFYRDITMNIREGSDKGSYLPLFSNLSDLINTVAVDENESEIVRLELLELGRAALHQYVPKFKVDGVTKEQILELYNVINETVTSIDTSADITAEKRQNTLQFMPDTLDRINIEYDT
ncbi:MAG: serine/threonine protein kinase [Lachnospiraceae bacterium]|nr:serine/threonine protein kinase [Lachnospiraceae bacterium]